MIDIQRKRVARGLAEEKRKGGLDKNVSVEMKRLSGMIVTYSELVNAPQAKAVAKPRPGTRAVSKILRRLTEKKSGRPKKNAA